MLPKDPFKPHSYCSLSSGPWSHGEPRSRWYRRQAGAVISRTSGFHYFVRITQESDTSLYLQEGSDHHWFYDVLFVNGSEQYILLVQRLRMVPWT